MKIVHLCLSAFYIDNYSYQENILPKYHIKMGYEVTVIASLFTFGKNGENSYLDGPSEYFDKNGFKIIRLAYRNPQIIFRILRKYVGLYDALSKENPDIIFAHNISMADTPIVRKYLDLHPKVQLFADSHTDYINSAHGFVSKNILHKIIWKYYSKQLEPYLSKYFGVTPMRCRFLKEMYGVNPQIVEFLPMGIDDDSIPDNRSIVRKTVREKLHIGQDDFVIFTGGKIDILKNTHILVEALKCKELQKVHLIICGVLTPPMEYLEQEFEMNPYIHYCGWCSAEKVMDCMVAADLACFPGTHSTLWEQSVGIGMPAIFKRWDEMEHVNVNGNCEFVKGDDVDELRNEIIRSLSTQSYSKMKKKADDASRFFLYSEISKKAIGL